MFVEISLNIIIIFVIINKKQHFKDFMNHNIYFKAKRGAFTL